MVEKFVMVMTMVEIFVMVSISGRRGSVIVIMVVAVVD